MVIHNFKKENFIWPQSPIPMFKESTIHFGGKILPPTIVINNVGITFLKFR